MHDQRAGQGMKGKSASMEDGGAELWVCEEGGVHRQGERRKGKAAGNHGEYRQHGWDMRSGKDEGVLDEGVREEDKWGLRPREGKEQAATPCGKRCTQ